MTTPLFEMNYVAFLDILGFKEMVRESISDPNGGHLAKLYRCHAKARALIASDPELEIIQFSDSIVTSKPYSENGFKIFSKIVADYQKNLLLEGVLCRGGISRGEHYSRDSFMMSNGLISAYFLESTTARFPRVVVSDELLGLLGRRYAKKSSLIQEEDGAVFLDFLSHCSRREKIKITNAATECIAKLKSTKNANLIEKAAWLANYLDHSIGTQISTSRFELPSLY